MKPPSERLLAAAMEFKEYIKLVQEENPWLEFAVSITDSEQSQTIAVLSPEMELIHALQAMSKAAGAQIYEIPVGNPELN